MNDSDFTNAAPGELVDTDIAGEVTSAFVPDALETVTVDQGDFVNEIGQAMRELGALEHVGPIAGSSNIVFEAFARKEAVHSSRIEGTQVTLADVYRYEAEQAAGETARDHEGARQATNYLAALDHGLGTIEADRTVTEDVLCEMHATLLDGVRSEDPSPGEIRETQNWLQPYAGAPVAEASYVPPPAEAARECLDSLLSYTNESQSIHALLKLGLIHYQFETIHPFRDGNGRLGRLLISLLIQRDELLSRPYLYLSAYFNEHRSDYVDLLTDVRTGGDWERWLRFFLNGIWQQANEGLFRGKQLVDLRRAYIDRYQSHRSANILPLALHLFEHPYITASQIEEELGCSHTTAYNLIDTLQADDVLDEAERRGRTQLYVATDIFDLLEKRPEEIEANAS